MLCQQSDLDNTGNTMTNVLDGRIRFFKRTYEFTMTSTPLRPMFVDGLDGYTQVSGSLSFPSS
jgi:hypothetical protein